MTPRMRIVFSILLFVGPVLSNPEQHGVQNHHVIGVSESIPLMYPNPQLYARQLCAPDEDLCPSTHQSSPDLTI